MMCQHGPEAAQRFGRNARPEQRDVALEVGADEVLPPPLTGSVARRQKAVGKAAPHPQGVQLFG